jgi:hypothetical protein
MVIWDVERGERVATQWQFTDGAWLNQFPDQSYDGDAVGKSRLYFVDSWAAVPSRLYPELDRSQRGG